MARLARVRRVAREELVGPRQVLAQIEEDEPGLGEASAIEGAGDLLERLGLGLGVEAELHLDRVARRSPCRGRTCGGTRARGGAPCRSGAPSR